MRRYLCLALVMTLTIAANANAGKCGGGKMKFFGGRKNKGVACASYAVASVQSCGNATAATFHSTATYHYSSSSMGVYASPQVPSKVTPAPAVTSNPPIFVEP